MINVSIVCGILIIMDIVCGTVAAMRNKELCSSIAREGMYNKIGEAMFLLIAIIANEILAMPPFDGLGISPDIAYLVAAYIAWMELVSILENICKINPEPPDHQTASGIRISSRKEIIYTLSKSSQSDY